MPIPTFSDVTKSLFDSKSGAFRDRSTGKAGLKFNTKSGNGFKFEADGSWNGDGGKTGFSFTYPKLGYKKFTGDLKVKGTVKGAKDSYKIQYKKFNLNKVGTVDFTVDMAKNNLEVDLTSKQDKFTLGVSTNVGLKGNSPANGTVSAVVGDGDTNFGVEVGYDLSDKAENRLAGPLGYPSFAAAYRPADGTELFFRSQGNLPFMSKGPALEIDLGATTVVDANNTVSFLYGLDCTKDTVNGRGAQVAGTRKIGDDTLEYVVGADGSIAGSYSTSLADRCTGKLNFSNNLGGLSLNGTKFGYSVEFA